MDDVEGTTPARFFEVGCHASNGVDFQVSMVAAA